MLVTAGLVVLCQAQDIDQTKVNNIKAAYIYHMAQLTTWPSDTDHGDSTVNVVFVGTTTDELAEILAENTRRRPVQGHPLQVERIRDLPSDSGPGSTFAARIGDADIVFVGEDLKDAFLEFSATIADQPVLIAGDGQTFPRQGGMVGFYVDNQRVRINVNLAQVENAGLRLSAEFLQHVVLVKPDGED